MPSLSRIGNSIFFIGLIVLVLAAIVFSVSEYSAELMAASIALVGIILMGVGGWLWSRPDPKRAVPLSQRSPELKIAAAVPALILLANSWLTGAKDKLLQFAGMGLLAYALAGLLELLIDRKFPNAKTSWDSLSTWKKVTISTFVIVSAILLFGAAMGPIATLIYE